jgi:hypothetical protein
MKPKYLLVTEVGAHARLKAAGIESTPTAFGALVEAPPDFAAIERELAALRRLLNPNRCTCVPGAILHRIRCPAFCWA